MLNLIYGPAAFGIFISILFLVSQKPLEGPARRLLIFLLFSFLWILSFYFIDTQTAELAVLRALSIAAIWSTFTSASLISLTNYLYRPIRNKHLVYTSYILAIIIAAIRIFDTSSSQIASYRPVVLADRQLGDILGVAFFIIAVSYSLVFLYKNMKMTQEHRDKLIFLVIAIATPLIAVGSFLGFILQSEYYYLFPIPMISIASLVLTYALVRHNIFESSLDLANNLSKLIRFLFLVAVGVLTWVISSTVQSNEVLSVILISLVFGIIFNPLSTSVGKLIQRVFFKNSEDPELLFSNLRNIYYISKIEDIIISATMERICEFLRYSYMATTIDHGGFSKSYFHGSRAEIEEQDIDQLTKQFDMYIASASTQENVLMVEDNRVDAIVEIRSPSKHIGYIVLGRKENGTKTNKYDLKIIREATKGFAIAIENALINKDLKEFNKKLRQEVRAQTNELRDINAKLIVADKTKDEFISMASHQLRTPLTAVKNLALMVAEGRMGKVNSRQKTALDQSSHSIDRMVALIDELLDVSRISTGTFTLNQSSFNFTNLVQRAIESSSNKADHSDIKILFKRSKTVKVSADKNKVNEVISNFLENAIQYSPEGSEISVEISRRNKNVQLKIIDQGIGVSKKEQTELFNKFYRASNAKKKRPDGTGLGLYLAKKIIQAHGGKIIFESKLNRGSTFGFTLPIA